MKALQCQCGHIMTEKEYEDISQCPKCWGSAVKMIRYRKCDCGVCKGKSVEIVASNEDYSQFVNGLVAPNRTELVAEPFHHAATGLISEAGEIIGMTKKAFWQGHPMDEEWFAKLFKEAGDNLFYLQFICNLLGVTLDDIRDGNVVKLTARYKSKKFTVNESINRKD